MGEFIVMNIDQPIPISGKDKKILIIGLGQIGFSNAEYMSSLGLKVDGYDINDKAVKRALDAKIIQNKATSFSDYDYYIICISTHNPEKMYMPFLDGLFQIAHRIKNEGKTNALVGIDSTITRGTSNKIMKILEHRLHVSHVPHRFYINEQMEHGVKQTRVLGGCESCCVKEAVHFYNELLNIPLHIVTPIDIAELTKVVENSYRFMEIAFAEELKIVCDNSNVDFKELRQAINTKWNIEILDAKEGIGGHCLPKDSQMFLDLTKNILPHSLLETAKIIDSRYRRHIELLQNTTVSEPYENNLVPDQSLTAETISSLKNEFNVTETDVKAYLYSIIKKIIDEDPELVKNTVYPKQDSR